MDIPELTSRDLSTEAADGYRLALRVIAPEKPSHVVLVTSGTGFPMGFYGRFARHLAATGAAVLLYDMRGIGASRPDDLAAMRMTYEDWGRLDMPAALDALVAEFPDLPVSHVGHSVGGHFAGFMPNHAKIGRHIRRRHHLKCSNFLGLLSTFVIFGSAQLPSI